MRRFVLILMLTLLPLQWTWAAAASYCEHETEASAAAHFGHHQHQHDGEAPADVDEGGSGIDADCPSCHGAVAGIMMVHPSKPHDWPADSQATPYRRSVTDGLPERLIRPPHSSPV